jgi:23S rRNA pseudouridine2605 synthase
MAPARPRAVEVRLQRHLSQAGIASRRKAEQMIRAGQVKVNGRVVTELGTKVDPERDTVEVAGKAAIRLEHAYFLLNKPKGYVTTVSDPQGRKTVMELLPQNAPRGVVPVGRLDFYTEGVLLLTNDGELSAALLHPRKKVEKTYHAKFRGEVAPRDIEKLRTGVKLDDGRRTMPAKVDLLKFTGTHTWLVITIAEGRSRQIHRMADSLGYQVIKLARVAFGGLTYFGLKVGEARKLTDREIRALRHTAGLDLDGH